MVQERRRDARVPADFLANRLVDGVPYLCLVTNVSRGGLLVRRMGGPRLREHDLRVDLQFPGQRMPLHCAGYVVHQDEREIGIRFGELSLEQQAMVEHYIEQHQLT